MINQKRILWLSSATISFFLLIYTGHIMYKFSHEYEPDINQITTLEEVDTYLKNEWIKQSPKDNPPLFVPTGLFIQSLNFTSSNNVHIAGYVWQKYNKDTIHIANKGVAFAEAVDLTLEESYRRQEAGILTIGWYFEGQFIQNFDYSDFPLDDKVVWVRMWHEEFDKNIVLMPDLASYDSTTQNDAFGIDPDIVLAGFSVLETFFSYKKSDYDTNFGLKNYVGKNGFPELYYNVSLEREVINSAIIYFLPLLTVLALMFFGVILITTNEEDINFLGYNFLNLLALAAFLLFVIVLSHTQLRTQVTSESILYLEYIYIISYFAIIYAIVVGYIIDRYCRHRTLALLGPDGLYAKVAFLPLVTFAIWLTTHVIFSHRLS